MHSQVSVKLGEELELGTEQELGGELGEELGIG